MLQKFKITCFDILKGNLYKGRDKLISEKTYINSIPKEGKYKLFLFHLQADSREPCLEGSTN